MTSLVWSRTRFSLLANLMTWWLLGRCQQRLIKNGITKEDTSPGTQRLPRKGDCEAKSEGEGRREATRRGRDTDPVVRGVSWYAVEFSFLSDQSPALQEIHIPLTKTSGKLDAAEDNERKRKRSGCTEER
ncbi:hypothetical protein P5V15_002308 [Pogonomyrmex californicus]